MLMMLVSKLYNYTVVHVGKKIPVKSVLCVHVN